MIERIMKFLSPHIPQDIAIKGLGKLDAGIGKFIAKSTAAGVGVDMILNFMRNQFGLGGETAEDRILTKGEEAGTLRPDESSLLSSRRQTKSGINLLQKGIGLAAGAVPAIAAGRAISAGSSALGGAELLAGRAGAAELGALEGPAAQRLLAGPAGEMAAEEAGAARLLTGPSVAGAEAEALGLPGELAAEIGAGAAGAEAVSPLDILSQYSQQLHEFISQRIGNTEPNLLASQAFQRKEFVQPLRQFQVDNNINFEDFLTQISGGLSQQQQAQPGKPPQQPGQPPQQAQPVDKGSAIRQQILQGIQQQDATLEAIMRKLSGK